MALTRARVLHGPTSGRKALEVTVRRVLELERDPAKLHADVLEMRSTMAQHKPAKGPLDIKLARGGLVDIEFLVHTLQLRDHLALVPSISTAIAQLIEYGKLNPDMVDAHALLARFLIAARLLAPDAQEPPAAARTVLAAICQCQDWDALLIRLAESRQIVAEAWKAVFGKELEPTQ